MNYLEYGVEDGCEGFTVGWPVQLKDVHAPEEKVVHHLYSEEEEEWDKFSTKENTFSEVVGDSQNKLVLHKTIVTYSKRVFPQYIFISFLSMPHGER